MGGIKGARDRKGDREGGEGMNGEGENGEGREKGLRRPEREGGEDERRDRKGRRKVN